MKRLIFLFLLIIFFIPKSYCTTYYIATNGSNANTGTLASPWLTLDHCNGRVVASDIVYVRGGTYLSPFPNSSPFHFYLNDLHGNSGNEILIQNYPNETVIFSMSNITPSTYADPIGLYISNCSYLHLKGFQVTFLRQIADGSGISRGGTLGVGSNHCTIEFCSFYNIGGPGFVIEGNSNNNLLVNDDFSYCGDGMSPDKWNNSDGLDISTGGDFSTNNVVRGSRFFLNADDGADTFNSDSFTTFDNCWSFWNGVAPWNLNSQVTPSDMTAANYNWHSNPALYASSGEGIKAGPAHSQDFNTVNRLIQNCLSFENRGTGYASNSLNALTRKHILYNNIAYKNDNDGFSYGAGWSIGASQVFKNNWAWDNNLQISGADFVYDGNCVAGNIVTNAWITTQGNCGTFGNLHPPVTINNLDFLSVSSAGMAGARNADGSLPYLPFLRLASTSDLINAGTDVGLPFCESKPDLGCFEYCPSFQVVCGSNQTITLPVSVATISALASGGQSPYAYVWRQIPATTTPVISNTTAPTTSVNFTVSGTFNFEVLATDNTGNTAKDSVQVVVNPSVATAPTCTGTGSATITLPINSAALVMTATSTQGDGIASYSWVKTSGPATGSITNASSASATAINLVQGTYVFTGTATDNNTLTCSAVKTITVNAALVIPTANAGSDQVVTLPTNSVSLSGSGSGGTITSYQWTLLQGVCVGCNFTTPSLAATNFTGLTAGIYLVQLRVGNSDGNFGRDTVQITVNPAVVLPTATCNPNISITLPINSCNLVGVGTGTATPLSFLWTKITGPATFTLVTPTATSTQFQNLIAGTYTIEYKVTDNLGNIARDTMQVVVNTQPSVPPVVTVTPKTQAISLPTSQVSVSGTVVVSSGTLAGVLWNQVSGGGSLTITSPSSLTTTITGFTSAGTYTFRLKGQDSNGLISYDTLTVFVNYTTSIIGVKAFNAYLYPNQIDGDTGWTFDYSQHPTTQYMQGQMLVNNVYVDYGAKILPTLKTVDYWSFFSLKGKPKGRYFFRVKQVDTETTYYCLPASVVKKK